jgi:membrane peptidoglycan carboxypeptidase
MVIRVAVLGLGALAVLLAGMVTYAAATLPDLNKLGQATGTIKILDRNGKPIASIGNDSQSRTFVPIAQVAPIMQDATLAAEDRNYYSEGAFDFPRIVKALFVDVIARRPQQGASTITQQLAKLAFFGSNADKSPLRKLREAMIASQIDSKYSKQQILEKYVNLIYYGEGAYGIENAAQVYFGKAAKDLTLQEASMLAGLPQAPSLYDPKQNPQSAFARQHYVLSGLVATGKITQQQADDVDPLVGGSNASDALLAKQQANQQSLQNELNHGKQIARLGSAPHFVQYVRDQLQQRFADDPSVTQGDLTVTTTLDLSIQAKANDAVAKGVAGIGRDANNGALLMIDSHTGDITAMVGSADYSDNSIAGQYNVVTGQRRPGSSFKPYVYETGFINGRIKPSTVLDDTPAESAKLGNVHDYDNRYQGRITAATALLESRNIPAEQAMVMAGVPDVINFAHSLGITSTLSDNPSTAIGTSTVRMIDHAAAYAAFSNYGHKLTPRAILKVVDGNGNTLVNEPTPSPGTQVMTQAQAYAITKILRNYPSHWGIHFNRPIASKSGTTDNYIDAYYMSYSPDYVVAAWAGHTSADGHEQGMKTVYGNDVGKYISAPFVNGLPGPSREFSAVNGALTDCTGSGASSSASVEGCPTPTPSTTPTPQPSATSSPTPTPSSVPTVTFQPPPTLPIGGSPTPSPSASPAPTKPGGSPAPTPP